jgi:hypothetical protein
VTSLADLAGLSACGVCRPQMAKVPMAFLNVRAGPLFDPPPTDWPHDPDLTPRRFLAAVKAAIETDDPTPEQVEFMRYVDRDREAQVLDIVATIQAKAAARIEVQRELAQDAYDRLVGHYSARKAPPSSS